MVKEAEIIEQQSAARAAPVAAAQPTSDYSAQWAEYYRSIGKVKEAEAIEQQMRAKGGSVPPGGAQYGAPQYSHAQYQQPGQPQGYQQY
jgi:far upstream element-binding protein